MTDMRRISFIVVLALALGKPAWANTDDTRDHSGQPPAVEIKRVSAPELTIEQKREIYQKALDAARQGKAKLMRKLIADLDDYPLIGQVEFEYYKRHLDSTPDDDIIRFIKRNSYMVFSDYLRERWLHKLAKKQEWDKFMRYYDIQSSRDKKLYCYHLTRQLKTSQDQAAVMASIERLWLNGRRLPSVCNPVFRKWSRAGYLSQDLVWARIKLAMESRRLSLARELSYYLPAQNRVWVTRWIRMHRHPARELAKINFPVVTPVARMVIKHGIARLAYRDPEAAMERWQNLKQKYQFFGEDENYVLRKLGILAAKHHLPQAVAWLSAVSANPNDQELAEWRVRAALRNGDWDRAEYFLTALPLGVQEEEEWRYWKARILEHKNRIVAARKEYERLAQSRSYYGFLASDHIGVSYSMQHKSVDAKPAELNTMSRRQDVGVAHELLEVGDTVNARRQWNWLTQRLSRRNLQVAAVIAKNWGWYDRAILTVSKSGHMDDLDLRFPLLYRDKVEKNADNVGLDPGWIFGVMRQESAFIKDARSPVGALGLMQLMPYTGRATARRLKLNIRSRSAILNVDNNLKLGSAYLKRVLDRTDGNQTLATASYNAGPHKVRRWLPKQDMDADIWVESIPYTETRHYIKNVFGYAAIYDHRLGTKLTRVVSRMPVVEGTEDEK
jgi:soluble lytic murein transglycosylase